MKKKESNYSKNAAKEGKFLDYTKFYTDRGTDTKDSWYSSVTGGHRMAKTKFDYSGTEGDEPMYSGIAKSTKKPVAKKGRRKV